MNKLPTMEEITSLYLYGQPIPPKNKLIPTLFLENVSHTQFLRKCL